MKRGRREEGGWWAGGEQLKRGSRVMVGDLAMKRRGEPQISKRLGQKSSHFFDKDRIFLPPPPQQWWALPPPSYFPLFLQLNPAIKIRSFPIRSGLFTGSH